MWYVFAVLAGYVATSIFYQKVSRRFDTPAPYAVWGTYGLLLWLFAGFVGLFGAERGIPFFLVVFAFSGPCALIVEYFLKANWSKSVTVCAGLAVLSGVVSMTGGVA